MKKYLLLLFPTVAFANALAPTPFPVFLKIGFSSVLEFEEAPVRVVLGDAQSFQVEKAEHSLVVRTLAPYAASNMFVYFKESEPRLFILTASEDASPTYYKKFESQAPPKPIPKPDVSRSLVIPKAGGRILKAEFDTKKDYLTVEFDLAADSKEPVKPNWSWVRLRYNKSAIVPYKLWAERKEIQKDARVKARLIFAKPNVPRNLQDVAVVIPLQGNPTPITLQLRGGK